LWSCSAVLIAALQVAGAEPGAKQKQAGKPKKQTAIKISAETTRIAEPLTKEGYPDYIGALNLHSSKDVTPENNFVVALWQQLGPKSLNDDDEAQIFKMLGIKPVPAEGEYFMSFDEYLNSEAGGGFKQIKKAQDGFHDAMQSPWNKKDQPLLAQWLTKYDAHINRLAKATERPKYYMPLIAVQDTEERAMLIAVLLPSVQEAREVARAFMTRAMLELGEGKSDAAWSDVMACYRLAELVRQGTTLIDSLVGIAISHMACEGVNAVSQHDKLTGQQLKQFRADLVGLKSSPDALAKIDRGERYMYLDCVCAVSRAGPQLLKALDGLAGAGDDKKMAELQRQLANSTIDWNIPMKMGNKFYDRLVAIGRMEDAEKREAEFDKFERDLKKMMASVKTGLLGAPLLLLGGEEGKRMISKQIGAVFVGLLMPALSSVVEAEHRAETRMRMADVALALAGFKLEAGQFPDRLAQLTPKLIKKLPVDAYSGAVLRYKRHGDDYLLYSIGPNRIDDEGRTIDDKDDLDADDIVTRTKGLEPKTE
jgi:hypothetical protein